MIKLNVIELQVKDFKKTLDWYKNLFKILHEEKNFAMLDTGKAILALYRGKRNLKTLYFRSGNLEKSLRSLKEKGVRVSPITKVHWGRKFYFADPEGNKHYVYEE